MSDSWPEAKRSRPTEPSEDVITDMANWKYVRDVLARVPAKWQKALRARLKGLERYELKLAAREAGVPLKKFREKGSELVLEVFKAFVEGYIATQLPADIARMPRAKMEKLARDVVRVGCALALSAEKAERIAVSVLDLDIARNRQRAYVRHEWEHSDFKRFLQNVHREVDYKVRPHLAGMSEESKNDFAFRIGNAAGGYRYRLTLRRAIRLAVAYFGEQVPVESLRQGFLHRTKPAGGRRGPLARYNGQKSVVSGGTTAQARRHGEERVSAPPRWIPVALAVQYAPGAILCGHTLDSLGNIVDGAVVAAPDRPYISNAECRRRLAAILKTSSSEHSQQIKDGREAYSAGRKLQMRGIEAPYHESLNSSASSGNHGSYNTDATILFTDDDDYLTAEEQEALDEPKYDGEGGFVDGVCSLGFNYSNPPRGVKVKSTDLSTIAYKLSPSDNELRNLWVSSRVDQAASIRARAGEEAAKAFAQNTEMLAERKATERGTKFQNAHGFDHGGEPLTEAKTARVASRAPRLDELLAAGVVPLQDWQEAVVAAMRGKPRRPFDGRTTPCTFAAGGRQALNYKPLPDFVSVDPMSKGDPRSLPCGELTVATLTSWPASQNSAAAPYTPEQLAAVAAWTAQRRDISPHTEMSGRRQKPGLAEPQRSRRQAPSQVRARSAKPIPLQTLAALAQEHKADALTANTGRFPADFIAHRHAWLRANSDYMARAYARRTLGTAARSDEPTLSAWPQTPGEIDTRASVLTKLIGIVAKDKNNYPVVKLVSLPFAQQHETHQLLLSRLRGAEKSAAAQTQRDIREVQTSRALRAENIRRAKHTTQEAFLSPPALPRHLVDQHIDYRFAPDAPGTANFQESAESAHHIAGDYYTTEGIAKAPPHYDNTGAVEKRCQRVTSEDIRGQLVAGREVIDYEGDPPNRRLLLNDGRWVSEAHVSLSDPVTAEIAKLLRLQPEEVTL